MKKGGDNYGKERAREIALLRAGLPAFEKRVARTLSLIEEAAKKGKIGVAFSGGKDSTVLLDLVRKVCPDAPAAFYDCGAELKQTYQIVEHYGVTVIKTEPSLIEACKYGGYWGYPNPVDPDATFDFGEFMIEKPAAKFAERENLKFIAIGLRSQESVSRRLNAAIKGELYYAKGYQMWHLCPLQYWDTGDIWAYIHSRDLKYNAAYDIMMAMGIPPENQRIAPVLNGSIQRLGHYVYLSRVDPDLFRRLADDFPNLRRYI